MEYKILTSEKEALKEVLQSNTTGNVVSRLENHVTQAISDGWLPIGGVSVVYNADRKTIIATQAMIRE